MCVAYYISAYSRISGLFLSPLVVAPTSTEATGTPSGLHTNATVICDNSLTKGIEKLLRQKRRGTHKNASTPSARVEEMRTNWSLSLMRKSDETYFSFKILHKDVLRLCEDEPFDQHFETFAQLSDLYESSKSQCIKLSSRPLQPTPAPTPSEQCLPLLYKPLELLTFNGK